MPPARRPAVAAGNLPYYISSPIIFRLLESRELFKSITVLVQKEVGERMAAAPGDSAYGPLSVFCGLEAGCELLFNVKKELFDPAPKVDSCLVRLAPGNHGSGREIHSRRALGLVVRGAFEHRRKTAYNSLKLSLAKGMLKELAGGAEPAELAAGALEAGGVEMRARPQEIPPDSFVSIADYLLGAGRGADPPGQVE